MEMTRSNQTYMLFSSLIFCALLSITGCAINSAQVNRPDLLNRNKMFIYGYADAADIYSTLKKNLLRIGFDVTENKDESELVVDYNYDCGWDVIHYTCLKFNMFITDTKSKEIVLKSKFWGSTPFSAGHLISNMFDKLEKELDKATVQPSGTPDRR